MATSLKKKANPTKSVANKSESEKTASKKGGSKKAVSDKSIIGKPASKKAVSKKSSPSSSTKKNKLGVKNSLVNNINARKEKGRSRSKKKSTISKDSYRHMEEGWENH